MEFTKHVSKTILIEASASAVWRALIDPSQIRLWMFDTPVEIISDWIVGSPLIFRHHLNGHLHEFKGEILALEPESIFQYSSWTDIMRLADEPENYSIITFRLTGKSHYTELTVTHNNLIAMASIEHANFYWNTTLLQFQKLVEA
jgi:uncharacterized protein YndB with AHSA1/START domain